MHVSSDVAIIADNRLSIAERLRLRWSIILFINRLSPTESSESQNAKRRIALSTKQSAGRVGFKWIMVSVTSPIRPNQHGPSSYFKHTTNKDLLLIKKSLFLLPKGSFAWNIDKKTRYESHLLGKLKTPSRPVSNSICVEDVYRTSWGISLIGYFCEWIHQFMANSA